MSDFSFSLLPNFWTSLLIVSNCIGRVVILIHIPGIGCFLCNTLRSRIVRTRVFGWHISRTNNHLRTHSTQHIKFGWGLLVVGYTNQFISFDNGSKRQTHPSVARCTFNDGTSWLKSSICLCIFNHFECHSILDRIARIKIFHLCQHQCIDLICN